MKKDELFLDIEATGIDPEDRLCQIAFKNKTVTYSDLFKPPLPVKLVAMSVNNITNKMLTERPAFEGSNAQKFLKEANATHILVAHNVPYDLGMLRKEGIDFDDYICTLKVAHYLDEGDKYEKHNLSYLRYYYDIDIEAHAHEALGDVLVLEKVYQALYQELFAQMFDKQGELMADDAVMTKMIEISKNPTLYRKFNFGKYKGLTIKEVAQDQVFDKKGRSWMKWLLAEKMNNPVGEEQDWIYTLNYYLDAYAPASR